MLGGWRVGLVRKQPPPKMLGLSEKAFSSQLSGAWLSLSLPGDSWWKGRKYVAIISTRHLKGWKVRDCQNDDPGFVHVMKASCSSLEHKPQPDSLLLPAGMLAAAHGGALVCGERGAPAPPPSRVLRGPFPRGAFPGISFLAL